VSDCGTPVFSDPGRVLVEKAIASGIRIVPVPGRRLSCRVDSVGFSIDQFLFYGWLSPKKERRRTELRQLQQERRTIVLMDTPYRLVPLLRDIADVFGSSRRMCIAFNLTLRMNRCSTELRRTLCRLFLTGDEREYVIVIEGRVRDRK